MSIEHVDVLIVGAGISGIGAAHHLQARCPGKSYAILEGRDSLGGTWDLFRYPGIRSDSDMYTLGYSFRPWTHPKAIADGPAILDYLRATAREEGIEPRIRFKHRVKSAAWSSADATWTVEVERSGELVQFSCNFLFMCSGYFRYDEGYMPEFPGIERFAGRVVHPQKWTPDISYAGQRVVVIGSGATAITLVPEMAKQAAHVTMLQRSPTYMFSLRSQDWVANGLRWLMPARAAYAVTRWKNVLLGMSFFWTSRHLPRIAKTLLVWRVRSALARGYDAATHFTPYYKPWDQRLCIVPDQDIFKAINAGRASVVTDQIERFTEKGIRLRSGAELEADLVVTATGLNLQVLGGLQLTVDGRRVDLSQSFHYKGMMYSDVPNLATSFGYTNASWTLRADLTCEYVCRLLNHMDRHGWRQCTPRNNDPSVAALPWLDLASGYVKRTQAQFPKQGSKGPWRLYQNYVLDILSLRFGRVDDGTMEFSRGAAPAPQRAGREAGAGVAS